MKRMSKQRTERICLENLDDIYDVSLSLIGVTLTGTDRGGASGHGRWGCCPSAEGAPSKLESILRSKTSQKNNSRKVYIREFKTAQDMIFASKQVSFVVLLKYWIFNVPFCRTFVRFLRCNMPKCPRNFPKSSWSHGRWSLCLKDREKISYKDEETYYKLCTADSTPIKLLWFARYGWQTNSELKKCNSELKTKSIYWKGCDCFPDCKSWSLQCDTVKMDSDISWRWRDEDAALQRDDVFWDLVIFQVVEVPVPLREERVMEVPQVQSVPLVWCSEKRSCGLRKVLTAEFRFLDDMICVMM